MYDGDGDVACDQYHKYKVSDPGVYLERTKKNCWIYTYMYNMNYIHHCSIFMLFTRKDFVVCSEWIAYLEFLQEDVQLMANMGLEAYRFSISWSRLIPGEIVKLLSGIFLNQFLK